MGRGRDESDVAEEVGVNRMRTIEKTESILFPIVDPANWAKRYSLSLKPKACSKCGKLQYPKIPFATSSWRGLQSELHECGPSHQLFRARDIDPDEQRDWKMAYARIKDSLS
jgi:hypothetical protein